MSYSREPIEFVTLETDACSLTFGQGLCVASGEPCYNTWATCRLPTAYTQTTKTYTFARASSAWPAGLSCVPVLQAIQYAPQLITPGKGLGVRGSVTLRLADVPWPDVTDDPYYDQRPYSGVDGYGTFFGRFQARHRFYTGRALNVCSGLVVGGALDAGSLQTRSYVVESITGPDKSGVVTITAKDVLKLADDDRAQCPRANTARVDTGISDTATALTLYPAGVGDAEFPASGVARVASELMTFTRSGDTLTLTRGQYNTTAKAINADDSVQLCAVFTNQPVQDLIYSLLVDYAGIPSSYINKSAWDTERNAHLSGVYSSIIADPVGVNTLIAELCEQGQCYIWWDEINAKIEFRALTAAPAYLPTYSDEAHFLAGSLQAGEATNERQSRFLIRFDRIDVTKKLDDVANYRQRHLAADLQSESVHEYGAAKMRVINSRWFSAGSLARVEQLGAALLSRYRDPPKTLECAFDSDDAPATGALFIASTRVLQTAAGSRAAIPFQVVESRVNPSAGSVAVKCSEMVWTGGAIDPSNATIYISADAWDVNLRTIFESEFGAPGADTVAHFVIMSDVLVTSSSTASPALVPGSWPAGATVVLDNAGTIAGRGGTGGTYGAPNGTAGGPGLDAGGMAITVNNTGTIAGGGGGGGAGAIQRNHVMGSVYMFFGSAPGGGGASFGPAGAQSPPTDLYTPPGEQSPAGHDGGRLLGGAGGDSGRVPWPTSGYGGDVGMDGQDGMLSSEGTDYDSPGLGGAAGVAILNGGLITLNNSGLILGS